VRRSLSPKKYTPRLACVKPAASVHPEPGSNSSSYIVCSDKSKLIIMRQLLYRFFSNLSIPLLLFFCPNISVKTAVNSICLRTCFFFVSLVSQSGCKSRKLISNRQMFFEVFFGKFSFPFLLKPYQSINELSNVLRGANVTSVFKSHKLFRIFFEKNFFV
jgi:hypothetical protein